MTTMTPTDLTEARRLAPIIEQFGGATAYQCAGMLRALADRCVEQDAELERLRALVASDDDLTVAYMAGAHDAKRSAHNADTALTTRAPCAECGAIHGPGQNTLCDATGQPAAPSLTVGERAADLERWLEAYWDAAYAEGKTGDNEAGRANEALQNIRRLALAPAAQAEPVAWIEHDYNGTGQRRLHFERRPATVRDEVIAPMWTPLYAASNPPAQGAGDAQDAARYRWLRDQREGDWGICAWTPDDWSWDTRAAAVVDAAIDAAMAAAKEQPQ